MAGLIAYNDANVISAMISANDVTDASNFPRIFTGADCTAVDPSKKGDIFVQDDGEIFIAKGTAKATDWVTITDA